MSRQSKNQKNQMKKLKKYISLAVMIIVAVIYLLENRNITDGLEKTVNKPAGGENSGFSMHFIDVGQGDSILVICDNEYMLVDAGERDYGDDVVNYLNSQGVKKLDYVVATHPHTDHIGGMPEVFESFEIETLIESPLKKSQLPNTSLYKKYCKTADENGCFVQKAYSGMTFSLGSAEVEVLGPVTDDTEGLNNMSVVMSITYGENVFLLEGDAEKFEENTLLEKNLIPDCDLLKVGHHGSSGSSTGDFLAQALPEICVIEVGEGNDYGHPSKKAVNRLSQYTDNIYRTDLCGNIVAKSDGKHITVNY